MSQQQSQRPPIQLEPEPFDPLAPDPMASPPAATGRVRVIAGADVQDLDLVGRCVGAARAVVQALFGVHPAALALVGGRQVPDDHVLTTGDHLEFVKYAGEKGGAPAPAGAAASTIEIAGAGCVWRRDGRQMGSMPVRRLLDRVAAAGGGPASWRVHPPGVRLMAERAGGSVVGVVVEMPPGPREVRWIADDSPEEVGPGTRYQRRWLSFPWVELFLVFRGGELTGMQQAFFRTAPIESLDDALSFTCLLNCAEAPAYAGQESWVCLVALAGRRLRRLSWPERLQAVTGHFWHAAFNRSSEVHEGNSYWGNAGAIDPRLAGADAWEQATRAHPYFALEVGWRRAPRSVGATLERMLDQVAPWRPVEGVEQLVTLMQQEG